MDHFVQQIVKTQDSTHTKIMNNVTILLITQKNVYMDAIHVFLLKINGYLFVLSVEKVLKWEMIINVLLFVLLKDSIGTMIYQTVLVKNGLEWNS